MFVGIGVGIGRNRFAQGIFNAYNLRVVADGGITEAGNCVNAVTGLLLNASLLIIPSGYKGGKAYAQIPTNGNGDLTWTRASDAWRTNADGLIQRVPWNLASYSEAFDNAAWSLDGVTISANQIASPTGTTTADLMTSNGTGQQRIYQVYTVSANSPYTISIYVKQGTTSTIQIVMPYVGAGPTFTFSTATFNTVSGWTSSVETLANGWYRISVTNTPTTTQAGFQLALPSNGSTVYLWGAQFNQGSSAQTYFPTTDRLNVPRLSYMYGSCPALLLEPQRTNLALYSEDFSNAYYGKSGSTITSNTTTAPDGNVTADSIIENTATGFHLISRGTFASGTNTLSVYAKANTRNFIYVALYNGSSDFGAYFNLSNGTVGNIDTGITASIQTAANGFYRCIITYTSAVSVTLSIGIASANGTRSYTGDGTSGIYIWGAQLEAGAYATTYIPTTTASATRIADTATKTGISSVITSPQGTLFVNCRALFNGGSFRGISISDGTYSNRLAIVQSSSSNTLLIALVIGNTFVVNQSITGFTQTNFNKVAVSWGSGTLKVFVNGSLSNTFTSITMPSANLFTRFGLDAGASASEFEGFVQATALFATPLSDSDCIALTT